MKALVFFSILVVTVALALAHPAIYFKLSIFSYAIGYEATCTDLLPQFPPPPNPIQSLKPTHQTRRKRKLIMIRHAESVWNTMANTSLGLSQRAANVARNVIEEVSMLANQKDSVFYDAKITDFGVEQSKSLAREFDTGGAVRNWLSKHHPKSPLRLVASNLRRSIETALISLAPLLEEDPLAMIHVDSSLQESCTKIDALSLQLNKGALDTEIKLKNGLGYDRVRPTYNLDGAKNSSCSVWKRHDRFLERLFTIYGDGEEEEIVIVVGHSAWFRRFFWRFAAADNALANLAGRKKFTNCAAAFVEVVVNPRRDGIPSIENMELLHGALA